MINTPRTPDHHLTHRTLVTLPEWDEATYAIFHTIDGFQKEVGMNLSRNGEQVWAVYGGTAVTSSRSFYDEERGRAASAIILRPGDIIEADGALYEVGVVINQSRHPTVIDPLRFFPVA